MLFDMSVTSSQLAAAAAWVGTGPDSAKVELRVDGDVLIAAQGDDEAAWAPDGYEVVVPVDPEDAERWRATLARLRDVVGADPVGSDGDGDATCRWAAVAERQDALGAVTKVTVWACRTEGEALRQLGDAVLDGYAADAIYDLGTGDRIEVHVATPAVTRSEDQGTMCNPLAGGDCGDDT
jgi:hypothetical protein